MAYAEYYYLIESTIKVDKMKLREENKGIFIQFEMAVTNIEYSLIAFLILIAIIFSVGATRGEEEAPYNSVTQRIAF